MPRPSRPRPDGWFAQELEAIERRPDAVDPRERLVAALVAAGIAFREVHLEKASLERLFVSSSIEAGTAGGAAA